MLKPYVCVACERVIIAKDDVASLIGLFSKITLIVKPGMDIPLNAVAPKEWSIFSIWDIDPGDELKEHTLYTKFIYPDGSQFAEVSKAKMVLQSGKRAQMVVTMSGFPIGQTGDYTVATWVEENGRIVVGPIEFKLGVEISNLPEPQPSGTP
jgi:hypothetical protein